MEIIFFVQIDRFIVQVVVYNRHFFFWETAAETNDNIMSNNFACVYYSKLNPKITDCWLLSDFYQPPHSRVLVL